VSGAADERGSDDAVIDALVTHGLLSVDARKVDVDLAAVLKGLVTREGEDTVLRAMVGVLGVPAVALMRSVLDTKAAGVVPRVICEREGFVPVGIDDDTLTVATSDVSDRPIFDQLRFVTGRSVVVVFAFEESVIEARRRLFDAYSTQQPLAKGPRATSDVVDLAFVRALPPDELEIAPDEPGFEDDLVTITVADDETPTALIVEDDDAIRTLLARVLVSDGFTVVEARTGQEGIDRLRTLRPSIAILDAMLPEVHGFEICRAIKLSPLFEGVPVIIISAVYKGLESAWEIEEVLHADGFVEKPFDLQFVRTLIANLTGRSLARTAPRLEHAAALQRAREASEQAYKAGDDHTAAAAAQAWATMDPFDPVPHMVLGNVHHRMGSPEAALRAYERAANFSPDLYGAWKNLALVAEKLGFTRKADRALARAAATAPDEGTRSRLLRTLRPT
jgi:CheY-like chemotaxis protein